MQVGLVGRAVRVGLDVIQVSVQDAAAADRAPAVHVAGPDVIGETDRGAVRGAPVVEHGARQRVVHQAFQHRVGSDLAGLVGGDRAVPDQFAG